MIILKGKEYRNGDYPTKIRNGYTGDLWVKVFKNSIHVWKNNPHIKNAFLLHDLEKYEPEVKVFENDKMVIFKSNNYRVYEKMSYGLLWIDSFNNLKDARNYIKE